MRQVTLLIEQDSSRIHHCDWTLPGGGVRYPWCGTFAMKSCSRTHAGGMVFFKRHRNTCSRAECPVCYEWWASKEAHRATRRLASYRTRRKPIHVIVSPPPAFANEFEEMASFKKARSLAYSNAKRCGLRGGVVMFHPFRWKCARCGRDDESCRCELGTPGAWYWSPHFHMVGYGWIEHTADNYSRTGWLVKNAGVRESVYRTMQYLLSHAGVWTSGYPASKKSKVCSITWFGVCSYSKLHVEPEEYRDVCPECGGKLEILSWDPLGEPPPELDELLGGRDEGMISSESWSAFCRGMVSLQSKLQSSVDVDSLGAEHNEAHKSPIDVDAWRNQLRNDALDYLRRVG